MIPQLVLAVKSQEPLTQRKKESMSPDDIINNYKEKLEGQPSIGTVEKERVEALKKVSNAQVLARLAARIVAAYQILADVSRGRSKVPAAKRVPPGMCG